MSDIVQPAMIHAEGRRGWRTALLRRVIAGLRYGGLVCVTPEGHRLEVQGDLPGPQARLVLHDWRLLRALALEGDTGFANAYIEGGWSSPDLSALLQICNLNFSGQAEGGLSAPLRALQGLRHKRRANSRAGARRNIMAHYDLGNGFFARWLDETMLYSSGLYEGGAATLEAAQAAKLALIAEWLAVEPGQSVLEIGCGWGALARHLGQQGARVTGLTISPAQLAWGQQVIRDAGLEERVELVLRDYRDEAGRYDRIVSVEMFEAVGEAYWPGYFQTLRQRLKPGGKAVLQVISIAAERFAAYRRSPDFIQSHIFPGGMLPAKAEIAAQARAAGLVPGRVRHFGASYARTLAAWRERFTAAWPALEGQGFDERFRRLWDYYLCYCEAGFLTGSVDVGLYELQG